MRPARSICTATCRASGMMNFFTTTRTHDAKIPFLKPSPIATALTRLIEFAEAKGDPAQIAQWKQALTKFNQTATPPTTAPPAKGQ